MDNSNQHIDLISKYLSKQTNAGEERLLFEWIEKDKLNQQQFEELKKAWDISNIQFDKEVDDIDLDVEWSKMEFAIAKPKIIDINKNSKKTKFSWLQIAASITILILIGSGLYYIFSPKETILTASQTILENKLTDGSVITLNQNSSISFNDNFNKKYREVELKGEAYFKVQHDRTRPFIVKAGELNVEVVGTSFYIKNVVNSTNIQVIVESGIVKIYDSNTKSEPTVLQAGESATYNTDNTKIEKSTNPDINTIAWKTKIFKFENTTFENIISMLNVCYNSNIIIKNDNLKKCIVTVSLDNQSIESILKVLKATLDIQIEQKEKLIEISGNGCENEKKK
jgi:transmembrane sensor